MSVMKQAETQFVGLLDFMTKEIERRGYDIQLFEPFTASGQVRVPALVEGELDGFERAVRLQEIEDAWNTQEPEPPFLVTLMPVFSKRMVLSVPA